MTHTTATRWQKLLEYYGACISLENAGEVELDSAKEGTSFLTLPTTDKEWMASGKERLELEGQDKKLQTFISESKANSNGKPPSYFYGFPCYIKNVQDKRQGGLRQIIQPILLFPVDFMQTEIGCSLGLLSDKPRINSAFCGEKSLQTSVEWRKQSVEAVLKSWREEKSREQNLKNTFVTLAEWLPQEIPFPKDILEGKTSAFGEKDGIYPTAILFKSVDSTYTIGLEKELKKLHDTTAPNKICRLILDRNTPLKEIHEEYDLLDVTGLNDDQRNAVKSAFHHTITIVTGPPGTGKSQVVLNIIVNALLKNESVLFSSKNHKAVDVVIERLETLLSEPVILKYDQNEKGRQLAETLLSAMDRASKKNAQELEAAIEKHRKELVAAQKEEQEARRSVLRILDRTNRINKLDLDFVTLKSEVSPSILSQLNQYNWMGHHSEFYAAVTSLEKRIKEMDGRPSWISRILAFFGSSLKSRIIGISQLLSSFLRAKGIFVPIHSIENCRELLAIARIMKRWIENQATRMQLMRENENEAPIEILRDRMIHSRNRAIGISLQYANVLMMHRLNTLSLETVRDINDYVDTLKKLESATGKLADDLWKKKQQLLESVIKVFPAIAVTNLSVRHALPLRAEVVDLVVIDEASQCDIASAIPLLYRGKRAVVIGDSNQLSHISLLPSSDDLRLQKKLDLISADDQRFLYSVQSLFGLVETTHKAGANRIPLTEHYRSHATIIGFSNRKFYRNTLSVWTDYRKLRSSGYSEAVSWHDVTGEVVRPADGSAYNLNEAKKIVELMGEIMGKISASKDHGKISLGVVTPFRAQANQIRMLAERQFKKDFLTRWDFIADTAHKYQGDERDIIIFSPVVSRRMQQGSLGFLGKTSNLFNVAITRARAELHVVGDKMACTQSGISHLSEFVKYVEELESTLIHPHATQFESEWEKNLYDALASEGVETIPQYSMDQYRLDLAFVDGPLSMDIEIDGEKWHKDLDGKRLLSDLKRDHYLAMRGWKIKRFWVYQLKYDMAKCVQEVKERIRSA